MAESKIRLTFYYYLDNDNHEKNTYKNFFSDINNNSHNNSFNMNNNNLSLDNNNSFFDNK